MCQYLFLKGHVLQIVIPTLFLQGQSKDGQFRLESAGGREGGGEGDKVSPSTHCRYHGVQTLRSSSSHSAMTPCQNNECRYI